MQISTRRRVERKLLLRQATLRLVVIPAWPLLLPRRASLLQLHRRRQLLLHLQRRAVLIRSNQSSYRTLPGHFADRAELFQAKNKTAEPRNTDLQCHPIFLDLSSRSAAERSAFASHSPQLRHFDRSIAKWRNLWLSTIPWYIYDIADKAVRASARISTHRKSRDEWRPQQLAVQAR